MHRHSQVLFVAAICIAGLVCWSSCTRQSASDQHPAPVQVVVATPIKKSIVEWDEYVGRFDAVDFVEVRARVSGYLQSIHFEEGQIVKERERFSLYYSRIAIRRGFQVPSSETLFGLIC